MGNSLESRIRYLMKFVLVAGAFMTIGTLAYLTNRDSYRVRRNLAPSSVDVGSLNHSDEQSHAYLTYRQNKDGAWQSVIRYPDKDGKFRELDLVWNNDGLPRIDYN